MNKFINRSFIVLAAFGLLGLIVPQQTYAASSSSSSIDQARDAEYEIMAEYVIMAPKIPSKKVKGTPADIASIKDVILETHSADTYLQTRNYMSSQSVEMFDRTPLFVNDINLAALEHTYTLLKIDKPKFYKGHQYAKAKVKQKNERNKKSTENYILIQENGVWKVDYVQMLKKEVEKYIRN